MNLQVILKATSACNGTCVYCSALSTMERRSTLQHEEVGPLFEAFADWLGADPTRQLTFIWHGGEPMLPGLEFFHHAAAEQQRVFGADRGRVRNMMQSNLTLLTEEWFPFLKDFLGKGIGSSFDIVDGVRGLRSGESLARKWIDAVRLCRRSGLAVGVVYVVHKRSLARARDVYTFFQNVDPKMGVRYNPLYQEGRAADADTADLAVTPEEYGAFLCDIADLWWADGGTPSIRPLKEWASAWQGDRSMLCCDSAGDCQQSHLGVAADGGVYGCGRSVDSGDSEQCLGNIFEDDLNGMLEHPRRFHMSARSEALLAGVCKDCPHWAVCHGGCPNDAILYYGDAMRETYFCSGRRMVFDLFQERWGALPRGTNPPVRGSGGVR